MKGSLRFGQSPLQSLRQAGSSSTRRTLFSRPSPARRAAFAVWTITGATLGGAFLLYASDTRASIHSWLVIPALHWYTEGDPEQSHRIAIKALESGLTPVDRKADDESLAVELWGRRFSNPIGLAAGFDKHAEAVDGLFDLGFGYVEVGSVTPEPQPGNPRPRMWRIYESGSVVNRYGFNSDGHDTVIARLRLRIREFVHQHAHRLSPSYFPPTPPGAAPDRTPVVTLLATDAGADAQLVDSLESQRSLRPGKVLAINLGKNKSSPPDDLNDYVNGVKKLGPLADVLVVNVSSPNTPGLRGLQRRGMLEELLTAVMKARDGLKGQYKPAVLLKIAPDLNAREIRDVAAAAKETKIDGVIVSNTTISRPSSAGTDPNLAESGGLSGPPLKPIALPVLSALYVATDGKIPLIGCGGIRSAQDALDYAHAGASFVQLYTALGYEGVGLPANIKDELTRRLREDRTTWSAQVGRDASKLAPKPAPAIGSREEQVEDLRSELDSVMQELKKAERAATERRRKERFGVAAFGGITAIEVDPASKPSLVTIQQGTLPVATTSAPTSGFTAPETANAQLVPIDQLEADKRAQREAAKPIEHQKPRQLTAPASSSTSKPRGLLALGSTFGARANAGTSGKRLV